MTPIQNIATKLLADYSKAGSLTLARMAFRDYPQVFLSVKSARSVFRRLRGASGAFQPGIKEFIRTPQKSGDPFSKIPKAKLHFGGEPWGIVPYSGPLKSLVLSDIHFPYHDDVALSTALRYGRDNKADFILLNGDIADFFSISFWEKDPRERNFAAEVQGVQSFLGIIREGFPKARIVYKLGNHEERFIRYMSVKAPELLGIPDFEFKNLFRLDDLGIELVDGMRPVQLGKLNVLHGHEYKFNISNPVNPARGFFLRAKVHCMGGHLHQSSQHSEKNLEGKVVSTWSTGCLCDLHPDYRPLNPWNHGFAFVEVYKDGMFDVRNLTILNGKIC